MNYSSAGVSDVPMMFEYPGHSNKTKEEAAEEQEEMLCDDDDVNMLTTKFTTINSTTRTTNEDDDEEEEQRQFADERNFAWALEETNNNKATRTTTTTTASLKRAVLPQQQQQQQSVMMNSNNNNETNNYKNYKSEADAIKSILKTRTTRTTNDEEMKDDDDSEKINSASTPSINVLEQARRTMRDRRQTLRVVELFMTLEKFDTESQLVDMVEKSLTRSEFKDACEERGLTGKCGWPLCSKDCVYVKINHNNNTNDNNNSNKNNNGGVGYKSKAIMKLLSDDEKTYCSAAHRKQSELFCEKFLREKVDDKKSLPPRSDRHTNFSESTMNSLDVIERNFDKKMTMTENNNDNNNTSNQSVKTVANNDENNNKNNNNNNNNIKKNEKSVKWNKELDDSLKTKDDNNDNNNNNNLVQEKKEEKKEEVGIFYFDIHEEGMRTNNSKSSKFIPSIGGRFAEGQLSSVPLRPDSPMNINLDTSLEEEGRDDGDDHDVDLNGEDAKMIFDDGNNINDINDNSVLHRELIKKALLANPVYKKYSPHGENDEAAETEESEQEESEEEEEEDEESFFILKKKEEDLSLFGQTWMVLDAWVSKSTHLHFGSKFLNDDDDEEVCAQKLPFRDSRSAQFAQSTSNEFAASMNRILRSSNQLNKKLQCEKYLALLMRTFDFQSTSHVPKWPESRWDLICAICLDLDSKRSGFCFDDYYKLYIITNDDEVDDNNSLSNILKEEEEIRLIKDLFLYARYRD